MSVVTDNASQPERLRERPPRAAELASRDRGFSAVQDRKFSRKSVLGWSDVLRAVPGDEARSRMLNLYRAEGFSPDDFARVRRAREGMADALTRTEDHLELGHRTERREAERRAIRDVRRRLEAELWP